MANAPNSSAPLVSIVLPTHNGERYLADAIQSCLSQTWKHLELIVVDDASSNEDAARIAQATGDPRVRFFRLDTNVGLPSALNHGFRQAKGELLTWTSDDNRFRPEAIEHLAAPILANQADLVYARCGTMDDDNRPGPPLQIRPPEYLPLGNCVGACFLYSKDVAQAVGEYDPDLRLAEDYDFWVRTSKRFRLLMLDDELYDYRYHGGNLTAMEGTPKVQEAVDRARQRHYDRPDILRAEGLAAWRRGDRIEGRKKLAAALLRRPGWTDLIRPWALCMLPQRLIRLLSRTPRHPPSGG